MLYHCKGKSKMLRRTAACLAVLFLLLSAQTIPLAQAYELPPVEVTARVALLIETGSEEILYQHNIYDKAYPASLTKIMTAMLAIEFAETQEEGFNQKVEAFPEALEGLDPQGSTQGIKAGEIMTVRDLLYCTLVSSANEACNVLAQYVSGSMPAFVELMNKRAKELGCKNTQFTNTHGLHDEDHYTTAYDIYLITREAMKHPEFMEICNTVATSIEPTNQTASARALHTTNHLISTLTTSQYVYHQAKGIKTGNTSMAGHCLVSSAEQKGLNLISVVMGADKEGETGLVLSFVETKRLLEWGFENFAVKTLLGTAEPIAKVKVHEGKDNDEVTLSPERKLEALVPIALDVADVQRKIKVFDEGGVSAPVLRGQVLGEIVLSYEDRVFGTIPLVATSEVTRNETVHVAKTIKDFITQDWVLYSLAGLAAAFVLYIVYVIVHNRRRRRNNPKGNYRGRRRR